jgi:LasA protease
VNGKFKLYSLLFILVLSVAFPFGGAAVPQADAKGTSLEEAVIQAMSAKPEAQGMSAQAVGDHAQVNVKRTDKSKGWVFGSAVITAPPEEGKYPVGWLFVAKKEKSGWQVGLEGNDLFAELSKQAPITIMKPHEKKAFSSGSMTAMAPYRTGMRLPYAVGASWTMSGGPHGWSGYNTPFSSVDLTGGDQRVLAARSGYVYTMCSNNLGWLRIVHDNGFSSDYYHLWSNIQPADGSYISEGSFLGYTGTDVSCGGSASGRHVHFALLYNGSYIGLSGREIGGWVFYETTAYNGYAMHGSTTVYPGGALYNYGKLNPNQGIVDANGGTYVNLRSGPGTNYSIVGTISDGAIITISCTAYGTSHTGRYGTTNLWNKLSTGQWISDAFVYTGSAGPVAPSCY